MDTTNPTVPHPPTGVVPSRTFSVSVVNAIIGSYVESAATLEDIANQCSISIPQVLECLHEQADFLRGMLNTLESRVRIIAARVEANAIQSLNDVVTFARDAESRRKAASKLLSHFAHSRPRPSRANPPASSAPSVPPVASPPPAIGTGPGPLGSSTHARGTGVPPVPTCPPESTAHPTTDPHA